MDTVGRIKERMFNNFQRKKEWWGSELTVLTDESIKELPIVIRKAMAIDMKINSMPAYIMPGELIIGMAGMASSELGHSFPEYATQEEKEEAARNGVGVHSVWAHVPINADKLLRLGLHGYRERIFYKLKEEMALTDRDERKISEYEAMLICLDALRRFADRYAKLALSDAAKEKDVKRKLELIEISRILSKTPVQPPETFQEALQCFWLVYCALQSTMDLIPVGRCDQYLYPFYEHDLESGIITHETAEELLASWLAKFSDRVQTDSSAWESHAEVTDFAPGGNPIDLSNKVPPYFTAPGTSNFGIAANSWFMNAILGGQKRDGSNASNELTYLILKTWHRLELIAPVMSVRFFKGSPQRLYDECAKILRSGCGEPALYNDDMIVKGFAEMGVPIEEARDYSNDGCWETLIPGYTDHNHVDVESLLQLEYTLHNGKSLIRNIKECELDTGDAKDFKDFEQLYEAYITHMKKCIEDGIKTRRKIYGVHSTIAPDPMLSIFIDDCVENGKDITNGGARYMMYPPIISGIANTVDSLAAIKKLIYEDKLFTMEQVIEALRSNFEGNEEMRKQLISWAPKFGNDEEIADQLMVRILSDMANFVKELQKDDTGMIIPLALGTFEHYAKLGARCGASPDGRYARDTISSNYSPAVGHDLNGPTAAILTCTKPDLLPYFGGCPLDIQINANEATGDEGLNRLTGLIRSFMELGGVIFTITGVSEEMLRDAQKNPEKHRGLRVRLGGYSGYFVALPPLHQEIMINRVKHGI